MGDEIYAEWENDERVAIIHFLNDIGQPYSCLQWGNLGTSDIPPIVGDDIGEVSDWFENPNAATSPGALILFIDHNMKIVNIMGSSPPLFMANSIIQGMIGALENDGLFINNKIKPEEFYTHKLYPNPFNPILSINFNISESALTQVDILDINGVHIKTIHFGFLQSGSYEISWDAKSMPSGIYLVSMKFGDENLTEKVILLK